jgi:hypothetical protein
MDEELENDLRMFRDSFINAQMKFYESFYPEWSKDKCGVEAEYDFRYELGKHLAHMFVPRDHKGKRKV